MYKTKRHLLIFFFAAILLTDIVNNNRLKAMGVQIGIAAIVEAIANSQIIPILTGVILSRNKTDSKNGILDEHLALPDAIPIPLNGVTSEPGIIAHPLAETIQVDSKSAYDSCIKFGVNSAALPKVSFSTDDGKLWSNVELVDKINALKTTPAFDFWDALSQEKSLVNAFYAAVHNCNLSIVNCFKDDIEIRADMLSEMQNSFLHKCPFLDQIDVIDRLFMLHSNSDGELAVLSPHHYKFKASTLLDAQLKLNKMYNCRMGSQFFPETREAFFNKYKMHNCPSIENSFSTVEPPYRMSKAKFLKSIKSNPKNKACLNNYKQEQLVIPRSEVERVWFLALAKKLCRRYGIVQDTKAWNKLSFEGMKTVLEDGDRRFAYVKQTQLEASIRSTYIKLFNLDASNIYVYELLDKLVDYSCDPATFGDKDKQLLLDIALDKKGYSKAREHFVQPNGILKCFANTPFAKKFVLNKSYSQDVQQGLIVTANRLCGFNEVDKNNGRSIYSALDALGCIKDFSEQDAKYILTTVNAVVKALDGEEYYQPILSEKDFWPFAYRAGGPTKEDLEALKEHALLFDNYEASSISLSNEKHGKDYKEILKNEGLLPKGGSNPFIPPKNKEGMIPRDKKGAYIDKKGNKWRWDSKKSEWDVTDKRGLGHKNINSEGNETHRGTHPDSSSDTSKTKREK